MHSPDMQCLLTHCILARMKITDIKTYIVGNPWKNWVFTRVETDEGIHGIGEAPVSIRMIPAAIEVLV